MKIDKLDLLQMQFVAGSIKEIASSVNQGILEPDYGMKEVEIGCLLLIKLLNEVIKNGK